MVVFHAEHFTCARQFCQLLEVDSCFGLFFLSTVEYTLMACKQSFSQEWNRNVAVCKDSLQGLEQLLQSLNAQQAATLSVPDTAFMTLVSLRSCGNPEFCFALSQRGHTNMLLACRLHQLHCTTICCEIRRVKKRSQRWIYCIQHRITIQFYRRLCTLHAGFVHPFAQPS